MLRHDFVLFEDGLFQLFQPGLKPGFPPFVVRELKQEANPKGSCCGATPKPLAGFAAQAH